MPKTERSHGVSMEKVERFKTKDDRLFTDKGKAKAHELFLVECDKIGAMLPARPDDGCKFANGDGYIQHTKEAFNAYKSGILRLGGKHCNKEMAKWSRNPEGVHNMGIAGRYFCDGNNDLYKLWHRVMCTDESYREWGQPYYALHPSRATHRERGAA